MDTLDTIGKDIPIVDLFPYKIKNREMFYQRDHPGGLHPDSREYLDYWTPFINKCVEGEWVFDHNNNDDEGTWVWMPGRLFRYINYAKINNKDRDMIHPDLRASDWIMAYYTECTYGFSGFEYDQEYTCHRTIERLEKDPDDVLQYEIDLLPTEVFKEDGSYKTFVHPWHYLTRFYLLERGHESPMGKALYQNPLRNSMIGAARGVGKSLVVFLLDHEHNIQFCGVNRVEDLDKVNRRKLIAFGSEAVPQLKRSINNLRNSYNNAPGKYRYPEEEGGDVSKGPLFKKLQGSWEVGSELNHIVKDSSGSLDTQGVSIQMVAMTTNRLTIAAGDRMDIVVEEAFFIPQLTELHSNLNDTIKVDNIQVARVTYLGTGGNIKAVKAPMRMMLNPSGYDIFGIPDYWGKTGKEIGLFIPKLYAVDAARDKNGNVDVHLAHEIVIKNRKKNFKEKDSVSYNKDIQFNPLTPMEMLQPSGQTMLPKKEAQQQLTKLETLPEYTRRLQVGKLEFKKGHHRQVKWERDLTGRLDPIIDITQDEDFATKDGAICIYEQPPSYIPNGLYWAIYDPAAKEGDGESYHAVIIYKWQYEGGSQSLSDTIVAEWVGRKMVLEDNFEEVIKLALYYNAKIFPEVNTPGFISYCKTNKYFHLLASDAYILEKEINPNHKRQFYRVGVNMGTRNKIWAEKKLPGWLTHVRYKDPETGVPLDRTMDHMYSKRALNEIISHTPGGNYDVYSCLLILMILLGKLEGSDKPVLNEDEPDELDQYDQMWTQLGHAGKEKRRNRKRAKFLNY